MFAAYFARRREDVSPETARHQERYDARLRAARRRGERRRAHWMEPLLATTLAESFELPGWVVDYFRLVKMEATTDAPVANPPPFERHDDGEGHAGGFPLVLFSHSFTGVKEQNSALLQELASWGHVVVAVDHPHDAALVLYPDGSTADFRGYDMPRELEPRNWWRFRHEHARWRALDLAHALERMVDANSDPDHPLFRKIDLSRVSVIGHSFGGAAAVMLAQMDPRITSAVLFDPWMWPLGRERAAAGLRVRCSCSRRRSSCGIATSSASPTGRCPVCSARRPRREPRVTVRARARTSASPRARSRTSGEAETAASGDGTGEEAVRSHGEGGGDGGVDDGEGSGEGERAEGGGSGEGECAEGGGSGEGECAEGSGEGEFAGGSGDASASSAASAASSAASSFAAAVSSENASVSAEHEDPSKPAPGFVGSHVDGFAGVGYYDEGRILLRRRRAWIRRDARLAHATQTRGDEPPATPPRRVRRYPRVRGIARIGRIARPRRGRDERPRRRRRFGRVGWFGGFGGFGGFGRASAPPRREAVVGRLRRIERIVGKHPRRRERQRRGRR